MIALATIVWWQRAKSHAPPTLPLNLGNAPQQQLQFAQIAMIVEAALLGYYLSRRNAGTRSDGTRNSSGG
jgi:hypothetical protein